MSVANLPAMLRLMGGVIVACVSAGCMSEGQAALDRDAGVAPSPWEELTEPGLVLEGGTAIGGRGRDGGRVVLRSRGAIVIDPVAAIPLTRAHASASALAAGPDAVRVITAPTGDLVVGGRLETTGQPLILRAPAGTVFVTGVIDSRAAGGAAGGVVIEARHVVVTGAILAAGDASATVGGDGGAIRIVATETAVLAGELDTSGGDAYGVGEVIGGRGGAITVTASSDVQLTGTLRLRGGAADSLIGRAVGGDAGVATFDTAGSLSIGAIVDGRGGPSSSTGEDEPGAGGAAGAVEVGAAIGPSTLVLAGAVRVSGGTGDAGGGAGGSATLVTSGDGALVIGPTGALFADGADGGGAGGAFYLETRDGDASMAGLILARGGTGGGRGGRLEVFTDANFDGVGGDLAIEGTGWIDVSGGGDGGGARNDGTGGVAYFPDEADQIAVLLNSDGMHGSPRDGTLVNRGHIVATGGAPDGWGGDVMFHGRQPGTDQDPLPGELTLDGSGAGRDGDFVPE